MPLWFRLLIVWCIAVALPVQGVAGMTMAHCGPGHERMGAAVDATAHRHADPEAGAAHHQHAGKAVAASLAGHASHDMADAPSDPVSDLAQYKCSSCASCCAGSALPPAMLRVPNAVAAQAVFAEKGVTVAAFASDGPDRPPRTPLV